MQISKAVIVCAALAVAACGSGFNVTRSAPERIALPDGTIIAGAQGWCVDEASSKARGETAVVVLGSCAAIGRNALAPQPDVAGVVTVSVESQAGPSPSIDALEAFFQTDSGRAALARDGQPGSIEILETQQEDGLLYLHAEDKSTPSGASPETWRALFDLDGRFVSVSLFGAPDSTIGRSAGLATLEAQVDELRAVNDG